MIYSEYLIKAVSHIFSEKYGENPLLIFSPGRVNLIGEHTDYNQGFVMPGAINKGIYAACAENGQELIRMYSIDFDEEVIVGLDALKPVATSWANYILGVVAEIKNLRPNVLGFDLVFGGDIPIGSGLSSSAALECAIGKGLDTMFLLNLEEIEIIKAGQQAEHKFVGVRCGIMDQFASLKGKANHVIQLDCRSLDYQFVPVLIDDYQLLLCNTRVKHSLAESSYNERRSDCETGVAVVQEKYPEVTSLRDVTTEMLDAVKVQLTTTIYQRCLYVIEENQRVLKAGKLLKEGQLQRFGALLFDSHEGLSQKYEVSCPELDFLVDQAKKHPAVLGARMMGGGFGGCTINLIKRSEKQGLMQQLQEAYNRQFGIELECYEVELEDGTHLIKQEHYGSI
ncbi:MAG: galactokinase [Flavobacteriaceae bacterium]|nr:galactokinase [Flavobacteriaceae bacterium]